MRFCLCQDPQGYVRSKASITHSFDRPVKLLKPHIYYPLRSNHVIWCHEMLPTKFALCEENFGIKYTNPAHTHHLVDTLKIYYTISIDWGGGNYYGLTLYWNYDKKYVGISMPGYIKKFLHKFQHPTPKEPQHALNDWNAQAYVSRVQYAQTEPDPLTLEPVGTQRVQSITGTLLYYSRAVNPTMLPAFNKIYTQQPKPTAHTINKCNRLLYYEATYPKAVICYNASKMILHGDTDASYLVLPKSCSRIAGNFYLIDHPPPTYTPKPKLKNVVASTAEAEAGGMLLNKQTMVSIRNTLIAMDHPQTENGNPLKSDRKTGF